ncbi:MAG: serine hydrolase [Gemmatimonadaceae bacterium]
MTKRVAQFLTLALFVSVNAHAQTPPDNAQVKRLVDSLGLSFVITHGAPAVSIAVMRGEQTLALGAWGLSDIENNVAATSHSVFRIGSITKQFTAAAVMRFVELKKIRVSDSVGTYLPTLPAAWRSVTVQQLLNHTSGIPDYTHLGARWVKRWGEVMPPDTIIALAANEPMDFAPGTSWRYDNSGYVVLGMLIEKLSGRKWATEVEERFFKPYGLTETRYCDTRSIIAERAHGYEQLQNGLFVNADFIDMSQPYAAGALCSTVGDLARWNSVLGNGKAVSAASYTQMTTPQGAAADSNYGYGLTRSTFEKRTVIRHSGRVPGFISDNAWFPETQTSITVLTNSGSARTAQLLNQVARATFGVPLLRVPVPVTISAQTRAQYVGVYAMQMGSAVVDFAITDRNEQIFAQLGKQAPNSLVPLGDNVFGAGFDEKLRITFTVEKGQATKLTLLQNGMTLVGLRKPN